MRRRYLSNFFDGPGHCYACHTLVGSLRCTSCKDRRGIEVVPSSSGGHLSRGQYQANLSAPISERCWNFKHIMDAFHSKKNCAICFIFENMNSDHVITICPLLRGKCIKCSAAGHWGKDCPIHFSFKPGVQCYVCMCPFNLHEVGMHTLTVSGTPCCHPAKDRLSIACWYLYRTVTSLIQKQNVHAAAQKYCTELLLSPNDFAKWLATSNDGIPNIVLMFGDLMGWRYIPKQ
jgi:hypothetical protein